MALSKLNSLYKAVVTDHSAHPHHQGRLEGVEQVSLNNPTCGDVISLSVQFDEQGMIEDIAFVNSGCSISTASASMMTDVVLGKTKDEALALAEIFSQMVQGYLKFPLLLLLPVHPSHYYQTTFLVRYALFLY